MILLLIPFAGLVLGVGLWLGLRGLGALSMGGETNVGRPGRRERRDRGERLSFRPTPDGVREWAERVPVGCLIAVIVVTGLWVVGWLIFLIIGLNVLS